MIVLNAFLTIKEAIKHSGKNEGLTRKSSHERVSLTEARTVSKSYCKWRQELL
jgi:hypothetical protein